jgi:hypothetical protein
VDEAMHGITMLHLLSSSLRQKCFMGRLKGCLASIISGCLASIISGCLSNIISGCLASIISGCLARIISGCLASFEKNSCISIPLKLINNCLNAIRWFLLHHFVSEYND